MYNNSPLPIGVIGAGMVLYAGHALICDSWRALTWDRASATILAVADDPHGVGTVASLAVTTQAGETIHIEAAPGVITDLRTPGPFELYLDRDHPASPVPVPDWPWRRNKLALLIMGFLLLGPALSSLALPSGARSIAGSSGSAIGSTVVSLGSGARRGPRCRCHGGCP